MGLKLSFKINGITSAIANANYEVKDRFNKEVQSGNLYVYSSGEGEIELVNTTGISAGDYLSVFVNNFTGNNFEAAGSAQDWIQVTGNGDNNSDDFSVVVNGNIATVTLWPGAPSSTVINWGDSYSNTFAQGNTHEYAQGGFYNLSIGGVTKVVTIASVPVVVPPIPNNTGTLTLIHVGDSITAQQTRQYGAVPADEGNIVYLRAPWMGALVSAQSDYLWQDNYGLSGEDTVQAMARVEQLKAIEGDVYVCAYGVNNIARADYTVEETIASYQGLLTELLTTGKSILICPILHTNCDNLNFILDLNDWIDQVNDAMRIFANTTDRVEMSAIPTEFNAEALLDLNGATGSLFRDGIHPLNRGGIIAGDPIAVGLDTFYPSTINRVDNLLPEFSGSAGTIVNASGVVPTGWKGSLASAWTFPFDRGDDKEWIKVVSSSRIQLDKYDIVSHAGYYTPEVTIEFEDADPVFLAQLSTGSNGSPYGTCLLANWQPASTVGKVFKSGRTYRLKTPPVRLVEGTAFVKLDIRAYGLTTAYITDFQLYKAEASEVNISYTLNGNTVTVVLPEGETGNVTYGDGSPATSSLSHTYTDAGTYTISAGAYSISVVIVPLVMPEVAYTSTINGLAVTFTVTGGDTYLTTVEGIDYTDSVFTHTFSSIGSFDVTFSATNPQGTDVLTESITVVAANANPVISGIQHTLDGLDISLSATVTDSDAGDTLTYAWTSNDGHSSSSETPEFTFTGNGSHTITLVVTDGNGGSDTETLTVTATAPLVNLLAGTGLDDMTGDPNGLLEPYYYKAGVFSGGEAYFENLVVGKNGYVAIRFDTLGLKVGDLIKWEVTVKAASGTSYFYLSNASGVNPIATTTLVADGTFHTASANYTVSSTTGYLSVKCNGHLTFESASITVIG